MCKKMYNELCEICQKAADCTVDYDGVTLDAITRKVVDCQGFVAVPKFKIKCTYECKELGKIAVVEKEVYKLPDLPWEDKKPKGKMKNEINLTIHKTAILRTYCIWYRVPCSRSKQ